MSEELNEKNWIAGAIKHPGAERNAAKRAGMSTHAYEEKHKHDGGKAGRRAVLGLTLSKMHKEEFEIDEDALFQAFDEFIDDVEEAELDEDITLDDLAEIFLEEVFDEAKASPDTPRVEKEEDGGKDPKKKKAPKGVGEELNAMIVAAAEEHPDDFTTLFNQLIGDAISNRVEDRKLELQKSFLGIDEAKGANPKSDTKKVEDEEDEGGGDGEKDDAKGSKGKNPKEDSKKVEKEENRGK